MSSWSDRSQSDNDSLRCRSNSSRRMRRSAQKRDTNMLSVTVKKGADMSDNDNSGEAKSGDEAMSSS